MRYYLSGPMTGRPDFNYPAFNKAAEILRAHGLEIVNPAENFEGDDSLPREVYMAKDVRDLMTCDAIILLPDWHTSKGARLELEIADQIGLEILQLDDDGELAPLDQTTTPEHLEAQSLVNGARNADYGHPLDDFSRTAQIWGAILGIYITAEQVSLCMIGLKLSREVNKPKRDNIVDAHGYLMTYRMVRQERERLKELMRRGDLNGNITT